MKDFVLPKKVGEIGKIAIYETAKKEIKIEVRLEKESAWLTQAQIAALFSTDRTVITRHIFNIFKSGELTEKGNVQKMHFPNSDKPIKFYNLNVIISVGYRVNSQRATKFRIWATKVLRDYIFKGYAVNQKRILETQERLQDLQKIIAFLREKTQTPLLENRAADILQLLSFYTKTFSILKQYDQRSLTKLRGSKSKYILKYSDGTEIVSQLKEHLLGGKETGDLFGQEVGFKLESILQNLYQTFDGKDLYPTLEEKASHLLYLIIKDHPFVDGNKRIASFLFIYFLKQNNYFYKLNGEKKIDENALTALSLLVAASHPKEKEIILGIIENLIYE